MSFGRNQSLGKPDLPIHHLHVYLPVQLVHKLFERMTTDLRFTAAASEEGKEYKHNSESETNSPYIVVAAPTTRKVQISRTHPVLRVPMYKAF